MPSERFEVGEMPERVAESLFSEYLGKQVMVSSKGSGHRVVSLPEFYLGHLDQVKDFQLRDDDVVILSYPKVRLTNRGSQEIIDQR